MRPLRSTRSPLRFVPRLECLEDRLAPAIAITPSYTGPYNTPYPLNPPAQAPGLFNPNQDFSFNGNTYQVVLDNLVATTAPSPGWLQLVQAHYPNFNVTVAQASPVNLTYTVKTYMASESTTTDLLGTPIPQVAVGVVGAMIDVQPGGYLPPLN
jgi:hypothetical protein